MLASVSVLNITLDVQIELLEMPVSFVSILEPVTIYIKEKNIMACLEFHFQDFYQLIMQESFKFLGHFRSTPGQLPVNFCKDTNRKKRKTELVYICGSLIGSKLGSSSTNTGERIWETQQRPYLSTNPTLNTHFNNPLHRYELQSQTGIFPEMYPSNFIIFLWKWSCNFLSGLEFEPSTFCF